MSTRPRPRASEKKLAVDTVSRTPQQGRSKASLERMLGAARELMLEGGNEEFTLLELQGVHEAVEGRRLQKDTFRRRVADGLVETGQVRAGTVGKPARIYRRAED